MSGFLTIYNTPDFLQVANEAASGLAQFNHSTCQGSAVDGASLIQNQRISPKFILLEIADFYPSFFDDLDQLANNCTSGTKVVVCGNVNDLVFYRELIKRGVAEYFVKPVAAADIRNVFAANSAKPDQAAQAEAVRDSKVISFMSSASGDGATTIAINTAYAIALKHKQPTLLIDMDYQFGLVARNLDIAFTTSLRDAYQQSAEAIDAVFLDKTIYAYRNNMFVLPTPRELGVMPSLQPQMLISMLQILRRKYKFIIIDVPHVWADWVAVVLSEVDRHILVSQPNLKSVTHASRMLDAFEKNGVPRSKISTLINRSGSRLKEPFSAAEFALATKQKVEFYVSNDSKTIALSEDKGQTAIETGAGLLNKQFEELADAIIGL